MINCLGHRREQKIIDAYKGERCLAESLRHNEGKHDVFVQARKQLGSLSGSRKDNRIYALSLPHGAALSQYGFGALRGNTICELGLIQVPKPLRSRKEVRAALLDIRAALIQVIKEIELKALAPRVVLQPDEQIALASPPKPSHWPSLRAVEPDEWHVHPLGEVFYET